MRFSKRVEFIRRLLDAGAKQELLHGLEKLGAHQSSLILRQLNDHDQGVLLGTLLGELFLDKILLELPEETLPKILSLLNQEQCSVLLSRMHADSVWAYLQNLPSETQQEFLNALPKNLKEAINKISQFPKDSCGEVMHTEMMFVKSSQSVEEVIQTIRQAESTFKIFYVYVLDEEGHLVGTVPLRSLIRENPMTLISQVMVPNPITVLALDSRRKAAQVVSQNELLAVPVVDESHHLLGVITVDDVMDFVQEEATEEMYLMAGLSKEDRVFAPWLKTAQKRLVWLSVNLLTALLAAWVVGLFRESIVKVVALAIFMPVVAGMGGNGGIQSLTVMTRALALGEVSGREVWRVLTREVLVGLSVGGVTGLMVGLIALKWEGNFYLGLVLWLAMILNMMIAGFSGSMIPMTLRAMRLDPALGSGVIVTTFTDVFGFLSFLGLATVFLKYLV